MYLFLFFYVQHGNGEGHIVILFVPIFPCLHLIKDSKDIQYFSLG